MAPPNYALLARVRHSLRTLNGVIERGANAAGLTLQQQAFLLSIAARRGSRVPLADVRSDLGMDQATTSELLRRLVQRGLVSRRAGTDRRALDVSVTQSGRTALRRSVAAIGREINVAKGRGDLDALQRNLRAYIAFHSE